MELRWAAAWSTGVMAAAIIPYVLAGWLAPPGYTFTGFLANPLDGFSYLAKMREAANGAWLLSLPYTSEPHNPIFIYPQYVLLGKLTALTGLSPLWLYHGSRLLTGLLMLAVLYAFIAAALTDAPARRTAFVLVSTASGFSWITSLWGIVAADAGIQISNSFHSLFSNMHFPLATALLIAPLVMLLRSLPHPGLSGRALILACASNALLALIAPFLLITQAAVGIVWLALLRARSGRHMQPKLLLLLLVPAVPAAAITAQVAINPAMAGWTAQNIIASPEPWSFVLGYGITLPFALLGILLVSRLPVSVSGFGFRVSSRVSRHLKLETRRPKPYLTPVARLLLVTWAIAGPILVYLPLPWQRRLMQGYDIPLGILAAVAVHTLLQRAGPAVQRRAVLAVVAFAMIGNVWLALTSLLGAQALREPHYLSDADSEGLRWLSQQAGRPDLVLASPTMGNIIPAWSDARVYWGHPFETLNADTKRQEVLRFYRRDTPEAARCALVKQSGATLVYWGPVEQRIDGLDLPQSPWLEPAYRSDPVVIYRVRPCEVLTGVHGSTQ